MLAHATPSHNPLDSLLEGLNPPQAEAAQTTEGPLLVLAGAGTGKTNVLTRRIAYLLLTGSARPNEILAVTFTNKAAKEMAERTEKLVGQSTAGMWLGTFHRLGVRFLRQHAENVGLRPDFVILDPDDQNRLINQIIKDNNLDTQQFPVRLVTSVFNRWKDNAYTPQTLPSEEYSHLNRLGHKMYTEYQQRLLSLNAADFGDLLLHPLTILLNNEALRTRYQSHFKYIMVDEYQDTNTVQYLWLKLLAAQHKNICVVGDDDQSIYGWRGAQVGNILKFEEDFPGGRVVRLEQNYRSTGHILAAANAVIANNKQRHGKALWTDVGHGHQVELHPLLDDREEARFVAEACQREQKEHGTFSRCAILVRTAAQTRALEEQFIRAGLPYVFVGGLKFYERKEIRDILAYLRLIANPQDDLAFQRIVNVPRRGVGETSLATIETEARSNTSGLEGATSRLIQRGELTGKAGNALGNFLSQLQNWRMLAQMESPDRLAERVVEESGYAQMLRDDKSTDEGTDAKTRLDNIKELLRALQEYPDLTSFLDHVALVTDAETDIGDAVSLMTIHGAKGLEFPTVFLPGFEEGLFPNQRALNEEGQKGLEEERRLAYVAITRARQRCIISFTHARRLYGQFLPGIPSRFVREIPEEHTKTFTSTAPQNNQFGYAGKGFGGFQGGFSQSPGFAGTTYIKAGGSGLGMKGYGAEGSGWNTQGAYRSTPGSTMDKRTSRSGSDYAKPAEPLVAYTNPTSEWQAGQRVFHQKFGYGRVTGTEGSGADQKISVAFDKAGPKKLLASLANLTKA